MGYSVQNDVLIVLGNIALVSPSYLFAYAFTRVPSKAQLSFEVRTLFCAALFVFGNFLI